MCPSTDEWVKKRWCLCPAGSYSAIKNGILSSAAKWMELEDMANKLNQAQKDKHPHFVIHG
jgi:hypothetical protein